MTETAPQALARWIAEGFQPEVVKSAEGWTVIFAQDGGHMPTWADWSGGPIWQPTWQEAVESAMLDEQMQLDHHRSVAHAKT